MNYELMAKETSSRIMGYIKSRGQVTASELGDFLLISQRAVFKQLANLVAEGKIEKIGQPPKVFYLLAKEKAILEEAILLDKKIRNVVDKNYLIITPSGERKEGLGGFAYWCRKNNLPVEKTAQ